MQADLQPLIIEGVDIAHTRLIDLTRLADQAEAFYDWVTIQFQGALKTSDSLETILHRISREELERCISVCYDAAGGDNLPILFDGIGRTYPHAKACYYFFSWLIRDAPQQRLGPLIQRAVRQSRKGRAEIEIRALASLIDKYRSHVKTFSWPAVREVIIDRLEGSRRSIRGHEKEAVVRTALATALQSYYTQHGNYGAYAGVEIPASQVTIGKETFDVSASLLNTTRDRVRRILIPIKTRETEGGGHAHLFSRDIRAAIIAARQEAPEDHLVVVIVARNWSGREAEAIREMVDHAAIFDMSPNDFSAFSDEEQQQLTGFIANVLSE